MGKFVITSYTDPDMDGISAMFAYSEYLNKSGKTASYYYEGKPKKEVEIVCNKYGIKLQPTSKIEENDKIILVDTGSLQGLSKQVKEENIVQIYDHHKRSSWLDGRQDIDAHIEEIGATATLITEKFIIDNMEISKEAAILLYFGIISNTMNLKIKMTTDRDIRAAEWLKNHIDNITDSDIKEVFIKKSSIIHDLRAEMEIEIVDSFMTISWTMGQLEIVDVDSFLKKHEQDIRIILDELHKEKNVEYISVNCMDILNGYSTIIAYDKKTADLIGKELNIDFINLKATTKTLISRKEIINIMREIYKK